MTSRTLHSISAGVLLMLCFLCANIEGAHAQKSSGEKPMFNVLKITMTMTNVEGMVKFYEHVFSTKLQPFDAYGTTLYSGSLLGFKVLFCPNSVAGVVAEQNRHQFDIETDDIQGVVQRAKESGGSVRDETDPNGGPAIMTVTDPDGNTMVFFEKK